MIIGFSLVFERQTTVRDVVQVFQPLEERHSYTTSVDVQVGNNQNVAVQKDFISGGSRGTIGSFRDDLKRTSCYFKNSPII